MRLAFSIHAVGAADGLKQGMPHMKTAKRGITYLVKASTARSKFLIK